MRLHSSRQFRTQPTPLDYDDLNYATSDERLGLMNNPRLRGRGGPLWNTLRFLGGGLRAWRTLDRRNEAGLPGKILAVATSHNQMRVISALRSSGPEAEEAVVPSTLVTRPHLPGLTFPLAQAYIASLPQLGQTYRAARMAKGYRRLGWQYAGSEYALTPGFLHMARALLRRTRPGLVLVCNDHLMRTRAIVRAAHDLGVPTAYVQHASVTDRFPPLFTTVALLDGRDALDKYLAAGPSSSRVFLTGSPLHDTLGRAGAGMRPSDVVGVCLNAHDEPGLAAALVSRLHETPGVGAVEVRTHPRDHRPWTHLLAAEGRATPKVVSAVEEPIEHFFARVGKVVAGDSNVHLEAAIFGRPSVRLDPGGGGADAYGFVRSGLVRSATDPASVATELAVAQVAPVEVIRRFSANAGGPWAGRSGELVVATLMAVAAGQSDPAPYSATARVEQVLVSALDPRQLDGLSGSLEQEAAL